MKIEFKTDPADFENELFETSSNAECSDQTNMSVATNIITAKSPPPTPPAPLSDEAKLKQKLAKKRSYSSYDYEITVQSIQNTVYEHAFFLLKNNRLKQLFGMFANLNGFNMQKWLMQYE